MTDIVERIRRLHEEAERQDGDEHCSGITIIPIREMLDWADEIERLRALALKFLDEQTEANADALRAACEVRQ